jgi:hypothetical protein
MRISATDRNGRVLLAPFQARIFDRHLPGVGLKLHEKIETRLFPR